MATLDYVRIYDHYWSRPDRWGGHSFKDPEWLANQVLTICHQGSILDVGCGMGLLVRTLLARGIDAYAIDVAPAVIDEGNRLTPGRYQQGSILDIPYPDDSFDSVISIDVLEHLAPEDVPRAIAELFRVTRRHAFIRLGTQPDIDKTWHLTLEPRSWWDKLFLAAGFRKHPLSQLVTGYDPLEDEHAWEIDFALEKIPAQARAAYPLDTLQQQRNLHMDMLRESGRRSDAHIARYTLARQYVHPDHTVLDAACGLGYGSAILAANTAAQCVIGIDNSPDAIEYADANFSTAYPATNFRYGDLTQPTSLVDRDIDLAVSFETLEHLHDPEPFLAQLAQTIRPGGQAIFSVPNDWTNESGQDPSPYHFRAYDWPKFYQQLSRHFIVEKAYAQIAGGAMKLTDQPRSLHEIPVTESQTAEAEWWIAIARKKGDQP